MKVHLFLGLHPQAFHFRFSRHTPFRYSSTLRVCPLKPLQPSILMSVYPNDHKPEGRCFSYLGVMSKASQSVHVGFRCCPFVPGKNFTI